LVVSHGHLLSPERFISCCVSIQQAGRFKTRLIQELLRRLNAEPERVKFPKSNMR